MKIRKANKQDISNGLLKLFSLGFNCHYEHRKDIFSLESEEKLSEILTKELSNEIVYIYVMEDNKNIIGYTVLEERNKATKSLWIDQIVIAPSYQNKGYGQAFMKEINNIAKEHKCVRIELNCWSWNSIALNFYEKLGFNTQRVILEKDVK